MSHIVGTLVLQPLVAVAGGSLGFFPLGAQGSSDSATQGSAGISSTQPETELSSVQLSNPECRAAWDAGGTSTPLAHAKGTAEELGTLVGACRFDGSTQRAPTVRKVEAWYVPHEEGHSDGAGTPRACKAREAEVSGTVHTATGADVADPWAHVADPLTGGGTAHTVDSAEGGDSSHIWGPHRTDGGGGMGHPAPGETHRFGGSTPFTAEDVEGWATQHMGENAEVAGLRRAHTARGAVADYVGAGHTAGGGRLCWYTTGAYGVQGRGAAHTVHRGGRRRWEHAACTHGAQGGGVAHIAQGGALRRRGHTAGAQGA